MEYWNGPEWEKEGLEAAYWWQWKVSLVITCILLTCPLGLTDQRDNIEALDRATEMQNKLSNALLVARSAWTEWCREA